HFTLFVQNGRVKDTKDYQLKTALRKIAEIHDGDLRLTPNQNLIIANVDESNKDNIQKIIDEYGITDGEHYTGLRRNSMACVAFTTCGLAMAESERYLPTLINKIEGLLDEAGLNEEEITIRMTGCPNGCARPALAEIAFIGKAPGKYNMYLGGGFAGDRLNKLFKESIIIILIQYRIEKDEGEHFGDFVIRKDIIKEKYSGQDFDSQ